METVSSENNELRFETEKEQILFSSGGLGCGFSSGFLPQPTESKDVTININNKASETTFFHPNKFISFLFMKKVKRSAEYHLAMIWGSDVFRLSS